MKKTIIILFLILVLFYAYYDSGIDARRNDMLRITYANVLFDNKKPEEATQTLLDTKADLILVSEWTGNNLDPIRLLSSGYKVVIDSPANGTHGNLLLARKEIGVTGDMAENPIQGPCSMPILTASLSYKDKLVTVLGVHAPPPISACGDTTDKSVRYFAGLVSEGRVARDIGVAREGDAVILVGDLNTLPFNTTIGEVRDTGLIDAHERAGRFLGSTWAPHPLLPKLARIDYLFLSPELDVRHLYNSRLPGSDHSLLVADFNIRQ